MKCLKEDCRHYAGTFESGCFLMDNAVGCEDYDSLKTKKDAVADVPCNVGLDSFAEAIRYILCEIEAHPEDSLKDIANDALMDNKIPLACEMVEGGYEIAPFEWKTD